MVQWVKGPGLATAAAWVRSLAEELPYIVSEAKKKKKKKKKNSCTDHEERRSLCQSHHVQLCCNASI